MRRTVFSLLLFGLMMAGVVAGEAAVSDEARVHQAESLYNQGVRAAQKGDLPRAEKLFKDALAMYRLTPGAYVELGRLRMAAGKPEEAVAYYLQARDAYIELHDFKLKSIQKKQQAELDKVDETDAARATGTLSSGGLAKTAANELKDENTRLKRDVVSVEQQVDIPALFYLYLGGAYIRLGGFDLAEKELREGLRRDSKLAPLHFNLAVIYLGRGRYEESAAEARLARKYGFTLPPAFVQDLESRGNLKLQSK